MAILVDVATASPASRTEVGSEGCVRVVSMKTVGLKLDEVDSSLGVVALVLTVVVLPFAYDGYILSSSSVVSR